MPKSIDYGLKVYDFTTDSTQDFVNGIAGTTDSNMHKIAKGLKEKVMLNQESSESNFNFIENKFVQKNLCTIKPIVHPLNTVQISRDITSTDKVTFQFELFVNQLENNGGWIITLYNEQTYTGEIQVSNSKIFIYFGGGYSSTNSIKYGCNKVIVQMQNDELTIILNDIATKHKLLKPTKIDRYLIGKNSGRQVLDGYVNMIVYNNLLSVHEINHNFNVLNQAPSLNLISIQDNDNNIKEYSFSTDENHVEMSTGRTLHDEYMGVLKTMGKEFESADGSDIAVENGLEARVVSGEISGRTIKNLVGYDETNGFVTYNGLDLELKVIANKWSTLAYGKDKVNILKPSTKYTLFVNVKNNVTITGEASVVCEFGSELIKSVRAWDARGIYYNSGETGIKNKVFTTKSDLTNVNCIMTAYSNEKVLLEGEGKIVFDILFVEGEYSNLDEIGVDLNRQLPFGLSSTQAIITNNGQEYKFYEPTIQGKTKILKANKGTQEWVEINSGETRDLTRYDYKLENVNNDLGSVKDVCDYIDISKRTKNVTSEQKTYNGTEEWWKSSLELGDYIQFGLDINNNASGQTCAISDIIPTSPNYSQSLQQEQVIVSTSGSKKQLRITILKSKLASQDAQGFKQWLASNPMTVRYLLETPSIINVTNEQLQQYESYKKVILLGGVNEDKDTLEILEQGDAILTKKTLSMNIDPNLIRVGTENETLITCVQSAGDIDIPKTAWEEDEGICNIFKWNKNYGNNPNCIAISSNKNISFTLLKEVCATLEEVKEYIKKNKIEIICTLETPKKIHLPKEIVQSILTQAINNISVGGSVKPSSYKLILPVDKITDIEKRLQALESTTVNIILNK